MAQISMAWPSTAPHSSALPCSAWLDAAQHGTARPHTALLGSAWPGLAWPVRAQLGTALLGSAQPGTRWPSLARLSLAQRGSARPEHRTHPVPAAPQRPMGAATIPVFAGRPDDPPGRGDYFPSSSWCVKERQIKTNEKLLKITWQRFNLKSLEAADGFFPLKHTHYAAAPLAGFCFK